MRDVVLACSILGAFALSLATSAASATEPDVPGVLAPLTDQALLDMQPKGAVLETRLDADLNGDGVIDTAYVARVPDEWRKLVVLTGFVDENSMGHGPVGEIAMDVYPLGAAALGVKNGVLIVEDLAGGTSAVSSTYRYRYDAGENRMRLIGDDVTYYSRTNQHDRIEISTNRLTGQRIRQVFKLTGEAYAPQPEVHEALPKAPIYMEEAPQPEATLGLAGAE